MTQLQLNIMNLMVFVCFQYFIIFLRASLLQMTYIRKYRQQNLDTIFKFREQRHNLTNHTPTSNLSLPRFARPSSESRLASSKIAPLSRVKTTSQKIMYNKLSHQLKQIKQSIATLAQRRKKKPSKYKQKVVTQVSEKEDPKSQIYRQVLKQIKEIKSNRQQTQQLGKSEDGKGNEKSDPNEKTLFYGVDYIQGIQFKIKIKLNKQKYCLLAKNSQTKLMLEMDTPDYMRLHTNLFSSNPCKIFSYLTIQNNTLKLSQDVGKKQSKSLKSYIGYY